MAELVLTVSGRHLALPQNVPEQITNTEFIDAVRFECDSQYNGYELVAVFKNGEHGTPYPVSVPHDRSAVSIDPRALRRKGWLYVGMYGLDGLKVLPTLWAPAIEIKDGTDTSGTENPDDPVPSVYAALVARVGALEDAVDDLEETVDDLEDAVGDLETAVDQLGDTVSEIEGDVADLQTSKQDVITDLDTIRSGAAAGATALQSVPIATPDTVGGGKFSNGLGLYVMTSGAYNGQVRTYPANDSDITGRSNNYRPITPANMDTAFRTCITDPAQELTDNQKAAACATIGAERSRGEWEFIDEFNTADGMDINLQGRKEFIIVSTINATNTVHLTANNGALYIASSIGASGNTRRAFLQYADNDMFGIVPMVYRYADNNQSLFTNGSAYVRPFTDPFFTSDIYHIEFHNASYITSCNVRIYAR